MSTIQELFQKLRATTTGEALEHLAQLENLVKTELQNTATKIQDLTSRLASLDTTNEELIKKYDRKLAEERSKREVIILGDFALQTSQLLGTFLGYNNGTVVQLFNQLKTNYKDLQEGKEVLKMMGINSFTKAQELDLFIIRYRGKRLPLTHPLTQDETKSEEALRILLRAAAENLMETGPVFGLWNICDIILQKSLKFRGFNQIPHINQTYDYFLGLAHDRMLKDLFSDPLDQFI